MTPDSLRLIVAAAHAGERERIHVAEDRVAREVVQAAKAALARGVKAKDLDADELRGVKRARPVEPAPAPVVKPGKDVPRG